MKKINGKYRLTDSFKNFSRLQNKPLKVYGYFQGFAFTTAYIPSKKIRLGKKEVTNLWRQLKENKNLWKFYDNHRTDLPPIGYICQAALLETNKWCGVFVVGAVISKDAFSRTRKGQLGGFSISFKTKGKQVQGTIGKPRLASLELEANSYSSAQIEDFKKAFSSEYDVVCNEVYKFSETPPLVIKIVIDLDIQNIVTLLVENPKESLFMLGAGVVGVKVIGLVVQDIYNFVKRATRQLFDNKGKRNPIILAEVELLGKKVFIRNSSNSEKGLIKNMEVVKKYIQNLSKSDLKQISVAKEIIFSVSEGNLRIKLDTKIYKSIKLNTK